MPRGPRAPAYVYRPSLTGRAGPLGRLKAAIAALSTGVGGLVTVGGESGIGKTRLVAEAARDAVRRGMLVVSGHSTARLGTGRAVPGGVPFEPLRPLLAALADRAQSEGPEEVARVFAGRAALLSPYEPSIAELARALDEPPPPSLPAELARARVLDALFTTLATFAERTPLLWLPDDLQWADELTLAFLHRIAARDPREVPWLTAGTFRSDEVEPPLAGLLAQPHTTRIQLDRFARDDIRDMISGMLAVDDPPEPLVDLLTDMTSGNPFFLGEYLRVAIDMGYLTRDDGGRFSLDDRATSHLASDVPLPRSLAALMEGRIHALGDAARHAAEAASVLGREVPTDWIGSVSGLSGEALLDAVQGLRVRHVLEDVSLGTLRFVHDKLRENIYARIPLPTRRGLHLRAAATLERTEAGLTEHAAAVAHHLAQGAAPARAARAYEIAADRARAAHANEQALTFYRAALTQAEKALAQLSVTTTGQATSPLPLSAAEHPLTTATLPRRSPPLTTATSPADHPLETGPSPSSSPPQPSARPSPACTSAPAMSSW
ncbi:MAG: AAA family ATPase [Polyangiaceae bacterium]